MRRPALALLLGCLLLVAGASALDGYDYYQTIEYAGCDQSVYQQDIVIHRSTGTAYNETAGGLETWHVFVGDHCREDYGDIRFTNSTGAELTYYLWPDYSSSSARFAVRLEGATSAGAVTAWYGNAGATTTSDGDATYEHWAYFGQTPPTGDYLSTDSWGTGHAVQSKVRIPSLGNAYYLCAWRDPGFTKYVAFRSWDSASFRGEIYSPYVYSTALRSQDTNWHVVEIRRIGTTASFIWDGEPVYSATHAVVDDALSVGTYGADYGKTSQLEWILVRTCSAAPPAATTFSGEQETAAPPATAFTTTPLAGLAPLAVQFTDTSAGTPTSWSWSFGDGNTSSSQNPQHTYTVPGTYSVTLTATNEYGSTPATKLDYITVYGPITAQFSATPTGGTAPLTVQFTDRSTGGPTSWSWTFGDGTTSTDQNPAHTYTTAGAHTVTLTASHPYDSDTETKPAYITVAVLQPFPGLTNIPRDLTGNGLYTDINGNNRLDYNDLTIFFQNLAWAKTAQPIACFDFNGNGWLDYNDVITLFMTISGGV